MLRKRMLVSAAAALLATTGLQAAQTCRNDSAATAPDSRFRDQVDGTVADLRTGLIWKRCAEGLSGADCATGRASVWTWSQALAHAANHVFAGQADWRLPNKNELASLVERRCHDPAINLRFFPNTPSSWFWSSSPGAFLSYGSWYIDFILGYVAEGNKSEQLSVRLVRGGQ